MTFDPEKYLDSLESIGWSLGLERISLLSDELGRPQDRYDTIHVVGTNGKSSVTRMIAALTEGHGIPSGCSLSPHLERWSERVLIGGEEIAPGSFAGAVERTAAAAERVNARLEGEEVVTQFEVATAAAFLALAEAGVGSAAIEAGLGGRLDATNAIESKVTVLTSIGLDHTEWLGDTELEIAGEKLAVLRPGTKLVTGRLSAEVATLAREKADQLDCELIDAGAPGPTEFDLATPGCFQRENFTVALAAAEALLGRLDPEAAQRVARSVVVPGRLERVDHDPPVYFDVAHNRPGAAALAASVPEIAGGRPVIGLIGTLADKDAPGMLTELAGVLDTAVLTELPGSALRRWGRPGAKTFPAADLAATAAGLGLDCEVVPNPANALSRATSMAAGRDGIVLVAGSHFLLSAVRTG